MKALWAWLRGLVGNSLPATIAIFVFIALLVLLSTRCSKAHGAEIDLRAGSSFGPGHSGPVLGLNLYKPIGNDVYLYGGTLLWGKTAVAASNWDWHGGFRACRWNVCASLGAAYLQRTDKIDGSHENFNLELSYRLGWHRIQSLDFAHLSNAGTSENGINLGRNAVLVSVKLQ